MDLMSKIEYFNKCDFEGRRWIICFDNFKGVIYVKDTEFLECSIGVIGLSDAFELCEILNRYNEDKLDLLGDVTCGDCFYLSNDDYCVIRLEDLDDLNFPCMHFKFIG